MILPLAFAALAAAPAPAAAPDQPVELRCGYIVSDKDGTHTLFTPEIRVLADTQRGGPYQPPIPAGAAIICGRSTMAPAENDWKVLAAGHPLAIIDSAPGAARIAWLEVPKGRVHYVFSKGALTRDEAAVAERRMNEFQAHLAK